MLTSSGILCYEIIYAQLSVIRLCVLITYPNEMSCALNPTLCNVYMHVCYDTSIRRGETDPRESETDGDKEGQLFLNAIYFLISMQTA